MRSMLFVPADSERKMAKAMASGADAVILDLEDSIAIDTKPRAREVARDFLKSTLASPANGQPRIYVRINDIATPFWQDDLAALELAMPHGIMLPKARSGEDVHQLSVALGHVEEKAGVHDGNDAHRRADHGSGDFGAADAELHRREQPARRFHVGR